MAIEAQISSGLVFGGCEDVLIENAQHHQIMQTLPKSIGDHHLSISHLISAQFEDQRIEIDNYINTQKERLRMAVVEQRRQQTTLLLKSYESKIQSLFKHKDDEIWRARRRKIELEECLRRMEMERQTWQKFAQESEATAASLIERVREKEASGAGSWCVERESEKEGETRKMVCRCCNSRKSCVIMLPCRHLCSCRECDAFLDCCPLCNLAKKATFQVLLFRYGI